MCAVLFMLFDATYFAKCELGSVNFKPCLYSECRAVDHYINMHQGWDIALNSALHSDYMAQKGYKNKDHTK